MYEKSTAKPCFLLQYLSEETVFGAIPVQESTPSFGQTYLKIPLGPLTNQRDAFGCGESGKHQAVSLLHGVQRRNKPLTVGVLDVQGVIVIWFLVFQGFQHLSAAGQGGGTGSGHQISTRRADIKLQILHISSVLRRFRKLTGKQIFQCDPEQGRQFGKDG